MRARAAAAVVDGVVLLVVCACLPQPFPPVLLFHRLGWHDGVRLTRTRPR
jgi:hypothetical protein